MADSITEQYRLLYVEDLFVATTFGQVTDTVLGVGPGTTVTPMCVGAVSDADAAGKGVPLGGVYLNQAAVPYYLKARLS